MLEFVHQSECAGCPYKYGKISVCKYHNRLLHVKRLATRSNGVVDFHIYPKRGHHSQSVDPLELYMFSVEHCEGVYWVVVYKVKNNLF